ncbi:MAG: metallophosphoesterase family protein [Chitinophagaceae bacterium]|jgi:putative phosphoesterase|nr:metallophosphoesterase family protein [Chitinophagaceae bacterium]OQY94108.1 MAG: YfcE family phosphodiesterase [Sphingobacteriales bacterium UTBCD1]
MIRIGLISDTHGYLDENIFKHFEKCDELWHAGDFGEGVAEAISAAIANRGIKFRGVYGNIDGRETRSEFPEQLVFNCEEVKVMIRHIGGSPPRYNPETKKELRIHQPQLFICGHSHILKIMYDEKIRCLYMNPGAAGKQGWHKMRTAVRFAINNKVIKDCEVISLGMKGA